MQLRILNIALIFVTLLVFGGCELFKEKKTRVPVARVFDKYLYQSDLKGSVPEGLNPRDSQIIAERYIDTWVKEQLMLSRAEQALSDEQKDFDKQIEEYRKSLLIYSYRQKLLHQKLDTSIHYDEIREYYENNINNFLISQDLIKGTYVKIALSTPGIENVRTLSRENSEEALIELEKYCISYADKYDDFNTHWIYFSSISDQFPMRISQPARYLRYNRNIETTDSLFRYFLHISDHKSEGEAAPIELVSDDIRSILLNKRKIEFFQDLEFRVYNDGINRNQFEIY